MFLSRVRLNPTRLTTRRLVSSDQVAHALVSGSMPPSASGGRALWRLDRRGAHDLELYVVSPGRPDFTGLIEQAGWPTAPAWDCADYGPFLERLAAGQEWRFRLTANTVRTVSTSAGRGRVVPTRGRVEQQHWLAEHASRIGVEFPLGSLTGDPDFQLLERDEARFTRHTDEDGVPRKDVVRLTKGTFVGRLVVRNPDTLRTSLSQGIGRAKAYGCGLMTLAPLS